MDELLRTKEVLNSWRETFPEINNLSDSEVDLFATKVQRTIWLQDHKQYKWYTKTTLTWGDHFPENIDVMIGTYLEALNGVKELFSSPSVGKYIKSITFQRVDLTTGEFAGIDVFTQENFNLV